MILLSYQIAQTLMNESLHPKVAMMLLNIQDTKIVFSESHLPWESAIDQFVMESTVFYF